MTKKLKFPSGTGLSALLHFDCRTATAPAANIDRAPDADILPAARLGTLKSAGTRAPVVAPTRAQRQRMERSAFLAQLIGRHHRGGMALTTKGVEAVRPALAKEYLHFQLVIQFETGVRTPWRSHHPLPANGTLLRYHRKLRKAGADPRCFLPAARKSASCSDAEMNDFGQVMGLLSAYASPAKPTKAHVAAAAVAQLRAINEARLAAGNGPLIGIRSRRTYQRWIDLHLDAFTVTLRRKGKAAALRMLKADKRRAHAVSIGQRVEVDEWKFDLATRKMTRRQGPSTPSDEPGSTSGTRRGGRLPSAE